MCFYNYHLDLDVSLVEHRKYGATDDERLLGTMAESYLEFYLPQ